MLEEKEQVAALVKQTLSELGLNKKAHIDFYPLISDSVGIREPVGPPPVWQWAPRWVIKLSYPTDDSEPTKTCSFQVNTADFQNESEIKAFVAAEIKEHL